MRKLFFSSFFLLTTFFCVAQNKRIDLQPTVNPVNGIKYVVVDVNGLTKLVDVVTAQKYAMPRVFTVGGTLTTNGNINYFGSFIKENGGLTITAYIDSNGVRHSTTDLSTYYTKNQTDGLLTAKANISHTHQKSEIVGLTTDLQSLSDATNLKQDKITYKQSGTTVAASGVITKVNVIGATAVPNNNDVTQLDITIPSGGATTNTFTANGSVFTSTVNGVVSTLTPTTGIIDKTLGFDINGNVVKQTPSTSSSVGLSKYDAGGGCIVYATGTGVTFTRLNTATYTFSIPSGIQLLSFKINTSAANFMGSNVTINYNYIGNTLTNQNVLTQEPPTVTLWSDSNTSFIPYVTGGTSSINFRPSIQTVGSGNISILYTLPSGITSGSTTLTGNF